MSTSEYSQPDPDAVQRAKREIQDIVQHIADLSRQDIAQERFYDEFLNKVVSALAASGGAVWTLSDAGNLQLNYQINWRSTGLIDNPIGQEQHGRLLTRALSEAEGMLVAPHSGASGGSDTDDEHAAANPTDYLLVMAPVHNDQGVQGVVEVFQRPGARPATQRGYLRFMLQTCELAGDYLRNRRLMHLADKQSLWEQLESFTRTAHEGLNVRETGYTIANEGRRLVGCDRVTVAVQRGGKCVLEAISGQDVFDKRSNIARLLAKTAGAVTKTAEDVWYDGDTSNLAPQVEKAIDAYVDESHTKSMAILPLVVREDEDKVAEQERRRKGPPKVLGALIFEQMVDSTTPEGYRQRVDVVRSHSTTAIGNALEYEGLFLMPVWKALGRATWMFRGRTLPKTLAILGLIGGLVAWSLLAKQDFSIMADGQLRPMKLTNVFAQVSGDVKEVYVRQNDIVAPGQRLLVQESIDLDKEILQVNGELKESRSEQQTLESATLDAGGLDDSERTKKAAQLEQVNIRIEGLLAQLNLLAVKKEKLTVRAPTGGKVITWKVQKELRSRPVQQGQIVIQIADLDADDPERGWHVELLVPEKSMGHIARGLREIQEQTGDPQASLEVEFHPATHPDRHVDGRVVKIDTTAETRGDDGNTVLVTVEFDQQEFLEIVKDPKLGAEVQAKLKCGRTSIAYAWLHELAAAFQSQWFRFKP